LARRLTWLDVFTATPMTGNGLAVVHEADDLGDEVMRAFARETNLSETTFVQTATDAGADYRNRIWMPDGELDFAGHPSIGTAVAVARERGEREARYLQQTRSGLHAIDVRLDGEVARASMLQGPATSYEEVDPAEALASVGLAAGDAHPGAPCQVVSCGQKHLMAPLRDADALLAVRPDAEALDALLQRHGCTVIYLAAPDGDAVEARSFFVQDGAPREDPATGSAAGPLIAHLHAHLGLDRFAIAQGLAMGRASRIDCAVEGDRVRVGGDVVVLAEGQIAL
jgi:trans-2,3-dihydro-3-hydroxyanthranilate isomerase